jgi:hypothetical protein
MEGLPSECGGNLKRGHYDPPIGRQSKKPRNLMGLIGVHDGVSDRDVPNRPVQHWQEPGAIHRMFVRMKSTRKQVKEVGFSLLFFRPQSSPTDLTGTRFWGTGWQGMSSLSSRQVAV